MTSGVEYALILLGEFDANHCWGLEGKSSEVRVIQVCHFWKIQDQIKKIGITLIFFCYLKKP